MIVRLTRTILGNPNDITTGLNASSISPCVINSNLNLSFSKLRLEESRGEATFKHVSSLLNLLELYQDRVHVLKGCVGLISDLSSRDHNFSRNKDKEHSFWFSYAIYKARKESWFIA